MASAHFLGTDHQMGAGQRRLAHGFASRLTRMPNWHAD